MVCKSENNCHFSFKYEVFQRNLKIKINFEFLVLTDCDIVTDGLQKRFSDMSKDLLSYKPIKGYDFYDCGAFYSRSDNNPKLFLMYQALER